MTGATPIDAGEAVGLGSLKIDTSKHSMSRAVNSLFASTRPGWDEVTQAMSPNSKQTAPTMKGASAHIGRSNLFFFLSVVVQAVRGFLLIPLLMRFVGVEGYGEWALVMSWLGYAQVISLNGLDLAVYQYVTPDLHSDKGRSTYWTIVRIAFVWASVLYVVAVGLAATLLSGNLIAIVGYGGLFVVAQVLWLLFLTPYRCHERTHVFLGAQIAITLGDFLVTVVATYVHRSLPAILLHLAVYHMAVAVLLFAIQRKRFAFADVAGPPIRTYIAFGLSMSVVQLITMGFFVMDKTIIAYFTGIGSLASYAPALSLVLVLLPLSAAGTVTLPTLLVRKEVRNSTEIKTSILQSAIKQWALIALPCGLGIALMAHYALSLLASAVLADIGAPITWVATVALLAEGLSRFANVALRAENDIYWATRIKAAHFVGFLVVAVVAVTLQPHRASLLVISAITLANISYSIFCFARLRRHIRHILRLRNFAMPVVGCTAIVICYAFVPPFTSLLSALAFVALAGAVYGLVAMAMERVGPRQLARSLFNLTPP